MLPLVLGSAGSAGAAGEAGTDDGSRAVPVPEAELVPGYPLPDKQPYQRNTPDQGAFPPDADGSTADGADGRRAGSERETPGAEYAVRSALIEYVPSGEEIPADGAKPEKPLCTVSTGPYQRAVERYLKLKVDGVQSRKDCEAIQKYQTRTGIYPNSGFAGPVTWKVLTLNWAREHPDRLTGCPKSSGRVACLDLNKQIMWVRKGDKLVYEPVAIRTGKPGYETRSGWHSIFKRVRDEWSHLYDVPMPFSQYFNGGQAIHGVYDDIYTTNGSHGCVNLQYQDAKRLWKVLRKGDRVYVWGEKPNR